MPNNGVDDICRRLYSFSPISIVDPAALEAGLPVVHECGDWVTLGEWQSGVVAIATPVKSSYQDQASPGRIGGPKLGTLVATSSDASVIGVSGAINGQSSSIGDAHDAGRSSTKRRARLLHAGDPPRP
jgi:hypothetical protein